MRAATARLVVLLCATSLAVPAHATDAAGVTTSSEPSSGRVDTDYLLHCGGCHGVDGRGTPGVTPTLHGLAALADTPSGRTYLMRVPGVAQAPLDDADLAALMDWVTAYFSDVPVRPRFDPAELGRLRASPLRDPVGARAALDAQLAALDDPPPSTPEGPAPR